MTERSSQTSAVSHTAQDYINSQLSLEAEAREALPYQFDSCTKPIGPLRQSLFSCLTCNPPPSSPSDPYNPAGICYSCSISCHGDHQLVELFNKRNFVCDCGTTRLSPDSPCALRTNGTGYRGGVHSETPAPGNKYNQNFRNLFCGCSENYDPHIEKGTMYQCIGLGTVDDGGCGEDWWHPECVVGLPRDWNQKQKIAEKGTGVGISGTDGKLIGPTTDEMPTSNGDSAVDGDTEQEAGVEGDDPPMPPGFPVEDDFEYFICYKCVEAFPWIKRYAGTEGFLSAVPHGPQGRLLDSHASDSQAETSGISMKRKADGIDDAPNAEVSIKRQKSDQETPLNGDAGYATSPPTVCSYEELPPTPAGPTSLFLKEEFRRHLCRCPTHFPLLKLHPPLLDDEATYSPLLSRSSSPAPGSVGSRSLLERGEAALSNVDRVRAIEGVMAYNHLRDKVKDFLRPFAESGHAVGAEDIKQYFETLRGDQEEIKNAASGANAEDGESEGDGDVRREQSGY